MADLPVSREVGAESTRLITLRGNSGSGKSTVAEAIRAARPSGTLAIIGQDVVRREIMGSGEDQGGHPISLTEMMSRHLLDRGVDVIIEGTLGSRRDTGRIGVQLEDLHAANVVVGPLQVPFGRLGGQPALTPVADQPPHPPG